jgi:uncharacterized membrane-anchored protein YjiN (DUF445 family)
MKAWPTLRATIGGRVAIAPRLKAAIWMEQKAKHTDNRHGRLWAELHRKAKSDPELEKRMEAIKRGLQENQEVLQRLADF